MWTSAHGFHHYTLSHRRGWRLLWAFILTVLVAALIICIVYYFYYVFSTAVYSRILSESPNERDWPVTIICEKHGFVLSRINSVNSMTISHASLLSWSLAPELSRPDVYAENPQIPILTTEIDNILQRGEFGGSYDKLISAISPNCTQFILECTVGTKIYTGKECCGTVFDPKPVMSRYGTCFTTKTAPLKHKVNLAGEGR